MKRPILHKKQPTPKPSRRQTSGDAGRVPGEHSSRSESRMFRRNLTIGQTAHPKNDETTPRAAAHQLRKTRRSLTSYLMLALGGIAVFAILVYQLTAQVSISLHGSLDTLSREHQSAYQRTIDEYFAIHPLERLRVLLDPVALSLHLQQHGHAEVESVQSVDFAGIGNTRLVLEVREPVARWIVDQKLQFVDQRGSVFTKNYYAAPAIKIVDKSGVTTTSNQTITSGRFLGFIGKAIGALDRHSYAVKEVIIPPATTRQIQLLTTKGTRIKMAIDRPVGEQAEDAARALAYMAQQKRAVQYIDVRVSGKVFYR